MASTNIIHQTVLVDDNAIPSHIDHHRISYRQLRDAIRHLTESASTLSNPPAVVSIGIAYHISSQTGRLEFLTLANTQTVYSIDFNQRFGPLDGDFVALVTAGGRPLGAGRPKCCLVGFSLAQTAVQVYQATELSLKGVDLSTLFTSNTWTPDLPADIVQTRVSRSVDRWKVTSLWMGDSYDERLMQKNVALQAWLASCVGKTCQIYLENALKIDASLMNATELLCLADMAAQFDLLDSHKPKESPSEFTKVTLNKFGKYEVENARYKTRIRRSNCAQIVVTDTDGQEHVGRAHAAKGRQTTIAMQGTKHRHQGQIQNIKVVGGQEPTNAERARNQLLHLLMTGKKDLRESPFIRMIWFPKWKPLDLGFESLIDPETADEVTCQMKLNESQRKVVRGMVGDLPIIVAHGPPGTGKTTTIAAASRIWDMHKCSVWIVAHSNVAVKNIAETLFKKDVNFTLLVSKEFYEEWHEHLYTEVLSKVIRSDELPDNILEMERAIGDSRIVLCTLSMLSNPSLLENGTFDVVPMERLVVDEASQINIFEFLHIFERFQHTLEKVAFFGDPKQLPPFGQDKVKTIRTIFDLGHMVNKTGGFFLDTQYRMPVPIGSFISEEMYGGCLRSIHSSRNPSCVTFIDVGGPKGEEQKVGFSWKNQGEIDAVMNLVKHYYKNKNFCVITPYDAQRAAIQKTLEAAKLPWDSVYNLDSFQGNEADYVLISVVRSNQPGFLVSENRMNVLLTRCRKATIVVSSEIFMTVSGGKRTVLGRMAAHWRREYQATWIDWRLVANGVIDLPDSLGPNREQRKARYNDTSLAQASRSTQTQKAPYIPWAYQSTSGGFSVSTLFPRNRETINQAASMPVGEYKSSVKQPTYADVASLLSFPLAPTKMPILQGTWKTIVRPTHTIHKHSLLLKPSNRKPKFAETTMAKQKPRDSYSDFIRSPFPASSPSRQPKKDVDRQQIPLRNLYFGNGFASTTIYSRRR